MGIPISDTEIGKNEKFYVPGDINGLHINVKFWKAITNRLFAFYYNFIREMFEKAGD